VADPASAAMPLASALTVLLARIATGRGFRSVGWRPGRFQPASRLRRNAGKTTGQESKKGSRLVVKAWAQQAVGNWLQSDERASQLGCPLECIPGQLGFRQRKQARCAALSWKVRFSPFKVAPAQLRSLDLMKYGLMSGPTFAAASPP